MADTKRDKSERDKSERDKSERDKSERDESGKPAPAPAELDPGVGRYIYGLLDLLFAGLYLFVFLGLVPSRSGLYTAVAVLVSGLLAAGGVGMILWTPWGRKLAKIACWVLIAACLLLLLGLATSAAYLHGIYDGVGQAGVALSAIVAALAIELVGLLPTLQLLFLRRVARGAGR